MGLDLNYVPLNYLETYFVDKDTGLPLSAGIVTFYKDQARTELKTVYKLSGTPPNYTYVPLPNPCVLNDAGCFVDASGNDIIPYALPYNANGDIELYYITVYSNDGHGSPAVLQWTREGQPNIGILESSDIGQKNYITNGQFKVRDSLPNSGLIASASTAITPGGWFYDRSTGSTATDYVTFTRFGSVTSAPVSYPRYVCNIKCSFPNLSDSFKYFGYRFPDVNKFASATNQYTLFFTAKSNSGSSFPVDIIIKKFYGTGGSPSATEIVTVKSALSIGTSYQDYNVSFIFGTNDGKILGTNDDDYVEILISLSPSVTFDCSFTNFALCVGELSLNQFPIMADEEFYTGSLFNTNSINPTADGMNLYLPVVLTPNGLSYSDADIGKIFLRADSTPGIGEHECDGTMVRASAYDSNGIPYARLQAKIFDNTANLPKYGTGAGFAWCRSTAAGNLLLTTNSPGLMTPVADGSVPTGFTFTNVALGSSGYLVRSSIDSTGKIYLDSIAKNTILSYSAGSSPFTVDSFRVSTALLNSDIVTIVTGAVMPSAGRYFNYADTVINYYFWFTIDGVGTDPAPGGTGVRINLLSTHTIADLQQIIKDTTAGYYIANIKPLAATAITAGSYFTFHTPSSGYFYVWYQKNGVGTDPAVPGAIGILVSLIGNETISQVASKTMIAVNKMYYQFPDFRGLNPRFWSHGETSNRDPDVASRSSWCAALAGDSLGSTQFWQVENHYHSIYGPGANLPEVAGTETSLQTETGRVSEFEYGGSQTNDYNVYIMPVIKY
jgi:hypothetical protein